MTQNIIPNNGKLRFLLTHPVWDVTVPSKWLCDVLRHFYSHIPCGMWPCSRCSCIGCIGNFYSHIPCGMWHSYREGWSSCIKFLLTHPVWDVTIVDPSAAALIVISTHTSRVGCDHSIMSFALIPTVFLLTHPVWDVTLNFKALLNRPGISTHTSRVGCDQNRRSGVGGKAYFYSHIPCGMWLARGHYGKMRRWFLLTHPVWDVTLRWRCSRSHTYNFYSHIPCGMWLL